MYAKTPTGKNRKGQVGIGAERGNLRLVLPRALYGGKQKYLYLGYADTPENRVKAQAVALRIQSDLEHPDNLFDPTLEKYKPKSVVLQLPTKTSEPSELELLRSQLQQVQEQMKLMAAMLEEQRKLIEQLTNK